MSIESGAEFTDKSPDDSDWSEFDREWFELQRQFKNAIPEQDLSVEDPELNDVIVEVAQEFIDYDLPRVLDVDAGVESSLILQFLNDYCEKRSEELRWSPEGLTEEDPALIFIEAMKAYKDRREAEEQAFFSAVAYRVIELRRNLDEYDDEFMKDIKSEMLAVFEIHYKLESEWLQFLHDSTSSDDDMTPYYTAIQSRHRDAAMESLPDFEQEQADKWRIFDNALALVDLNLIEEEPLRITMIVKAVMNMQEASLEEAHTEAELANRNEVIWQEGREANLSNDAIRKLADFFDRTYPLQS